MIASDHRAEEPVPGKHRVLVSWSSGKDAAWTLNKLRCAGAYEIVGLLTTLNEAFDRVAMHAVRRTLLEAQALAVGLPLIPVPLPWPCTNVQYEAIMERALEDARRALAITHVAFGDLFLQDIRRYREDQMARQDGLTPLFPLWEIPTDALAREMIACGLRARVTCVNPRCLSPEFAGREFSADFLADLPPEVDPCGENGEFHTFVYDGPMFSHPLDIHLGEIVERDGFVFADLVPNDAPDPAIA